MVLSPLRASPLGDGFRPGVAAPEQVADFGPGASGSECLDGGALDRVQLAIACGQVLACFAGGETALDGVFDGFDLGDSRLQGIRERFCHALRVEGNTPCLNRVLTSTQKVLSMVLKPRALHRPKRLAPLHRCIKTKTAPAQGLHSLARA